MMALGIRNIIKCKLRRSKYPTRAATESDLHIIVPIMTFTY